MADPDPRFLLANERTLLAWLRTALALIGGGLAAYPLLAETLSTPVRRALAVTVVAVGSGAAVAGYRRWVQVERAVRGDVPLPASRAPLALTAAVLALAAGAVAVALAAG